jgi:hypothetical protein
MGFNGIDSVELVDVYTVSSPSLEEKDLQKCGELLSNPVMQGFLVGKGFCPKYVFS